MAAVNLFVLQDADNSEIGLVKSFTDDTPTDPPELVRGDKKKYRIHHVKRNPVQVPGRPLIYGARPNTLRVGAGVIDSVSDSGSYTLTGPLGGTTAAINQTDTATQIRDKLRAGFTSGGSITVTVHSSSGSTYYTIDWGTTGAVSGTITADPAGLQPSGSTVGINNSQDGTSLLNEKWEIRLQKALPFLCTSWTAFASVSTAATLLQAGSATARKVYTLTWNSDAVDGATYWLVSDGSTSTTVAIPYNATSDEVVAAFAVHTGLDDTAEVECVQNGPGNYTVTFPLSLANGPTIGATASSNTLVVPVGDEAVIAVSTAGANAILGDDEEADITFEIEASPNADEPGTFVRLATTLKKDLLGNSPGWQTGGDVFVTEGSLYDDRAPVRIAETSGDVVTLTPTIEGELLFLTGETYNFYSATGTAEGDWDSAIGAVVVSAQELRALGVKTAITTKTDSYTATATDHTILFNIASGKSCNLPAAASNNGRIYVIKNLPTSSANVTIDGNASETVEGLATIDAAPGDVWIIQCDGAAWHVIGFSQI